MPTIRPTVPLSRTPSLQSLPSDTSQRARATGTQPSAPIVLDEPHCEALCNWVTSTPDILELPARNEALARILHCAQVRHHTLDLGALGLSNLPAIVFEMEWLLSLRLNNNQLSDWPEGLSRLPQLRHVNLAHNPITVLPAEFDRLQARCHFVLEGSPLEPIHRARVLPHPLPGCPPGTTRSGPFSYAQTLNQFPVTAPEPSPADEPHPSLNQTRNQILILRSFAMRDGWPQRELDAGIDETTRELAEHLPRTIETWALHAGGVGQLLPAINPDTATHLINDEHAGSFCAWLTRLDETADHAFPGERVLQNTRVLGVLKHVLNDASLRGLIFSIAREAIESCGDRIAIGLNQMEMAIVNTRAERGELSAEERFELGRTQYRLDRLRAIAHEHARRVGQDHELVEVELAFQNGLREALALPVGNRRMLYTVSAQVRQKDLDEAQAAILAGETEPVNAALDHLARLTQPEKATDALLRPPPRHPLASSIAEHSRLGVCTQDSPIKAQMYRCLEELAERVESGEITTATYLAACREAMFHANHGERYRQALEHLQTPRAG